MVLLSSRSQLIVVVAIVIEEGTINYRREIRETHQKSSTRDPPINDYVFSAAPATTRNTLANEPLLY